MPHADPLRKPDKPPEPRFVSEFTHQPRKRNAFLRRVLMLAVVQLLLIIGLTAWATSASSEPLFGADHPLTQQGAIPIVRGQWWALILCVAAVAVLFVLMTCCVERVATLFPLNWVLLLAFSVAVAYLIACIADNYNRGLVLRTLAFVALLQFVLVLWTLLPGVGFSHTVAALFCLFVVVLVGCLHVLLEPEHFAGDWSWVQRSEAWREEGAAYENVGIAIVLLCTLLACFYIQYLLASLSKTTEPHMWMAAAFAVNSSIVLLAGTAFGVVAALYQQGTAYVATLLKR